MDSKGISELEISISPQDVDRALKLDRNGLPLVPQPSYPDDPLNWSPSLKLAVILQVSWLAFLGPMAAAVANPTFVVIAKSFNMTTVEASYELMVYILFAGIGPLLVVPIANVYGRRPIYLLGNLIAAVTNIAAGYTSSWTGVMVTRAINGVAAGSPPAIGAATVCDLYFMHERGLYMGIFTFFLTNGPHLASLMGGFIAQYLSWHWCFRIPAFIQLATFLVSLFCLPETLYDRLPASHYKPKAVASRLALFTKSDEKMPLHVRALWQPLLMLRYPAVLIPGLYYMTAFAYGSVIFASTGSQLFREYYTFNTSQTGLLLSIPLLLGCLVGEASTGWFTDWLVLRDAKQHDGERRPEARIQALWLGLAVPAGLIIEGVCLSHRTTWVGPAIGMALASLGLQAATTVTYTYCTDCYQSNSADISVLLNLFRCAFSAAVGFYALPLADRIDIQFAWVTFAMINVAFFGPFILLGVYGHSLRAVGIEKNMQGV